MAKRRNRAGVRVGSIALACLVACGSSACGRVAGLSVTPTPVEIYLKAYAALEMTEKASLPALQSATHAYVTGIQKCASPIARIAAKQGRTGARARVGEAVLSEEVFDAIGLEVARTSTAILRQRDPSDARMVKTLRVGSRHDQRLLDILRAEESAWATLQAPTLCHDLLAWARRGFRTVPESASHFVNRLQAIERATTSALLGRNIQLSRAPDIQEMLFKGLSASGDVNDRALGNVAQATAGRLSATLSATSLAEGERLWRGLGLDS